MNPYLSQYIKKLPKLGIKVSSEDVASINQWLKYIDKTKINAVLDGYFLEWKVGMANQLKQDLKANSGRLRANEYLKREAFSK